MPENNAPFGKISYPYAVARVRARESTLLPPAKWSQLAEADETQALKLLRESGYGDGAEADVDTLTRRELAKTTEFINEISPDRDTTNLFFLSADAHNLKVLLKARLLHEDADYLLLPDGLFEPELLKLCVEHEDFAPLGEEMKAALEGVFQLTDPKLLSARVDRAVYLLIDRSLSKNANPLARRYFELREAYLNRVSALRAQRLGWEDSSLAPLLLPEKKEEWSDGPAVPEGTTPEELEEKMEEQLLEVFRAEKYDSNGIAPILCFLLEKRAEARKLRALFAAKRAGRKPNADSVERGTAG